MNSDDLNEINRESVLRRFSGRLESVRLAVGRPSYAKLQAIVEHLRPSTISTVLSGKTNPTLDFVLHFVSACATFARRAGHPVSEELVDENAWRDNWLQVQRQLGALRRSTSGSQAGAESEQAQCAMLAFTWAYRKLAPDLRAFFRVLSLYLAPEFDLHAAAELLSLPDDATLFRLEILIAAGLAERADNDTYRIQDLLDSLPVDFSRKRDRRAQCQHCTAQW